MNYKVVKKKKIFTFFFKCKKKKKKKKKKKAENMNSKVVKTKKRQNNVIIKIAVCGSKKSKCLKEQETKAILSSLGRKTALSKIPLFSDILF